MSLTLIAESGATKTDWVLVRKGKKERQLKSSGINPYLQNKDQVMEALKADVQLDEKVDRIFFYGAGVSGKENKHILKTALKDHFGCKEIEVESDMLAAARGLSKDKKGMICILGTGCNSCYYDGAKIKEQLPSLGYIAGDEGSGNHMGKRILQYYAYNTFDTELRMYFEQHIDSSLPDILDKLYRQPFPNRYLATYVRLLTGNRGHFMVENIIEDCLNDFFHHHLFKYRQSWKSPIHFTGSVAFVFADVIRNLCEQYELELGNILQNPLDGLVTYHS
jgi:N-acetylglucosamine kinase-like BadF-type ATPase